MKWLTLASLVLLSGCSREPAKLRIAVGGQTQLVYLPTTLADRLGYYKDEGLDVELQDFQGGAKSLEALFGGSTDVVSGFFDHTVQMAEQGKELKAFVSMLRYPGLALVVAPGNPAASIKDLAGKTVGVSSPGSSTHMYLKYLLRKEGLAPDSVSAIGIGMASGAIAAMETGMVTAAVMAEPAMTELRNRKGELRILSETQTAEGVKGVYGVETYPAAVLYAKKEWLQANPDNAKRLAKAIRRTLAWIAAHNGSEIAARMPAWMQAHGAVIERSKAMYSPDGTFHKDAAEAVLRVMGASGDAARFYTNEFVE